MGKLILSLLLITLISLCIPTAGLYSKTPSVSVRKVRMITGGGKNHFFGYYGINVWNKDKTHLLSLETDFNDRLPYPGEMATIGLVNLKTLEFSPLTQTCAWNMQQGCMMFWNPRKPNEEFYFNDVVDNKLVAVRYNIRKGSRTILPYPVSGLSHDGKYAISLDYGRVSRLRKVVSYSGTTDPNPTVAHPDDDGVFIVNLETEERKLLVSFARMADIIQVSRPDIRDKHLWNEHAEFSRNDQKILFLPRTWQNDGKNLETGLFTINADGTDLKEILPYGSNVSHFGWKDDEEMVITYNYQGKRRSHVLVNGPGKKPVPLKNLEHDGHCSFDKTGTWVLTDGPADLKNVQNCVRIMHVPTQMDFILHTFDMKEPRFLGAGGKSDTRCDLHPRISSDNKMICVDAIDPETLRRQIFILDISLRK